MEYRTTGPPIRHQSRRFQIYRSTIYSSGSLDSEPIPGRFGTNFYLKVEIGDE